MNVYKESFVNMEEMMRRLLHTQKNVPPSSSTEHSSNNSGREKTIVVEGLLAGKELKIDVSRFNSTETKDYVFKIREFFDICGVPAEQWIKIASFHMEDPAYAWYKWVVKNNLVQTRNEFHNALLLRFGTSLYEDPKAALKELK